MPHWLNRMIILLKFGGWLNFVSLGPSLLLCTNRRWVTVLRMMHIQWRISPRWGRQPSGGGRAPTYNFAQFSQKLYEIERISTPVGGASLAPSLRSATDIDMYWSPSISDFDPIPPTKHQFSSYYSWSSRKNLTAQNLKMKKSLSTLPDI